MNKRDNPYTPGAGRKPRTLAGRDQDLESFQALVERLDAGSYERSLIYTGLRGVGKTVLLMEFDVLASEAGWATTDVQEVGSNADFRTTFAGMANRLLVNMSRRHRAKQRIEHAFRVVKSFSIAIPGAVELKLDVDAASGLADSGDPEQDLAGLFREIGEVAQANRMGALFLSLGIRPGHPSDQGKSGLFQGNSIFDRPPFRAISPCFALRVARTTPDFGCCTLLHAA
jgi:hypothetical protein